MKTRMMTMGLSAAMLVAGLQGATALAGDACCHMKGAKGKGECSMGAKDVKNCPFTEKRMSKTDKEMYVCPDKDYCSAKPGKCPTSGKDLKKMFCPGGNMTEKPAANAKKI